MVKNQHTSVSFPGRMPGEVFQFYFRQHWMRLQRAGQTFVIGTLLYAAMLALLLGMPGDDTRRLLLFLTSGVFILLQLTLLVRLYTYFLYVIVVSDTKVHRIKKTLLTVDDRQSIDLWSLSEVTKQQRGIVQNMLGFGTMVLHGNEQLKIHFAPRIRYQIERLAVLRTQARARAMGTAPPASTDGQS